MPVPHSVARFNKVATNRVARVIAGQLPYLGIIIHRGRRSGRLYSTPVNVFPRPGFVVALTYGRGDWVKNVLAAGQAQVRTRGRTYDVRNPRVLPEPPPGGIPLPMRWILSALKVHEFMWLDDAASGTAEVPGTTAESAE